MNNNSNLGRGTFGRIVTLNYLKKMFSAPPELWSFTPNLKLVRTSDRIRRDDLVCKIYLDSSNSKTRSKDYATNFPLNALYNWDKFRHIVEYLAENIDLDLLACYDRNVMEKKGQPCNGEINSIPELALELSKNIRVGSILQDKSCLYGDIILCKFQMDEINFVFPIYARFEGDLLKLSKTKGLSVNWWDYIANEILISLNQLHTNDLYHFDIKPANILYKSQTIALSDYGMVSTTKTTNYFKGTYQFQSIFSLMIPGEYMDACVGSLLDSDKCDRIANSYDYMNHIKSIISDDSNDSCDQINKDPELLRTFFYARNVSGKSCKTIADYIWKSIFRKNDLYALGVTLLKLAKDIKLDKNREIFVDKLLLGEISDNFYDANAALKFLAKIR